MTRSPAPLTAAQAGALGQAFRLLQGGAVSEALAIARKVLAQAPASPDALHFLALCLKSSGDLAGSVAAFERALVVAPRNPHMLGNYGNLLRLMGRVQDAVARYEQALALDPHHAETWMNLALAQLDRDDGAAASRAAARAAELAPSAAPVWHTLGAARRRSGDLEGAEAALRKAVALAPGNGLAWTALGIVRRLQGDPADALSCYARARAAGLDTPELLDAEASAHLDLGDAEKALAAAGTLTQRAPAYAPGQVMLAHILWEHRASAEEDPFAAFRRAVAEQPGNVQLRKELVRALLDADRAKEALEHVRVLRTESNDPALVVAQVEALHKLGERETAERVFEEARPRMQPFPSVAYARHLLRLGRPEPAAAHALEAVQRNPSDQSALSVLGVAWRLLGDEREQWLCDYEQLVVTAEVEPPAGFASLADFMETLTAHLTALHVARRAPMNQSLREGSQTSGNLFGRPEPIIVAARDALRQAAERMLARLPQDASHPFLRRNTRHVRFIGAWSVRLASSGRHVNHFHPEGWLSSAFYVRLPPSVAREGAGQQGWIQFGQPPAELGVDLPPRRVLRPREGHLVVFPSYFWHGTTPFTDEVPRLTIAFDAQPAPLSV